MTKLPTVAEIVAQLLTFPQDWKFAVDDPDTGWTMFPHIREAYDGLITVTAEYHEDRNEDLQ